MINNSIHLKHIELIKYLLDQNVEISSLRLAQQLSISSRTIKHYISQINSVTEEKLIISTRKGYIIDKKSALKFLEKKDSNIPQNYNERSIYIIKELLIKHRNKIDVYELCEELFVSYSTVKSDIAKMNNEYALFNISFHFENDNILIHGIEKNKRKLISNILFDELNQNFMNLAIIQDSFINYSIDTISNIYTSTFKKYQYYINDFSFMTLILHTIILIDRVKYKKPLNLNKRYLDINNIERTLIDDLCMQIENSFSITLDEDERFELYLLCISNTNNLNINSSADIQKFVGTSLLHITENIITSVNDTFLVDLRNYSFIKPFTLHLKNLLMRAENNIKSINPLLNSIKKQYLSLYEIAVFISLKLKEELSINITEDEIAFIALHIGGEIERQKSNNEKISCVLLCPKYLGMETEIYNQLMFNFGNDINIISRISYPEEIQQFKFDVLISTVKFHNSDRYETIFIPPLANSINKLILINAFENIQKKKKNKVLKENFDQFFPEDFFFLNQNFSNHIETISVLADKLQAYNHVNNDFKENVLQRESISSTAFGNIAIPHSVKMDSFKTTICVVLDKNGIKWKDENVNLVLLVAINKYEINIFRELYESLISFFNPDGNMLEHLLQLTDYQSFKRYILANLN